MSYIGGVHVTTETEICDDGDGVEKCKLVPSKCCGTGCHWDNVRQCETCGAYEVHQDAIAATTAEPT